MSDLSTTPSKPSPRNACRGVWDIVQFNWPFYVLSLLLAAAAFAVAASQMVSAWAGWLLVAGAGCALYWLAASLAASHWVYDRSAIADWSFVPQVMSNFNSRTLRCWANVHAGYDTSTDHLRLLFPQSSGVAIDLFNPVLLRERSIHRAHARARAVSGTVHGAPDHLPVEGASLDAAFLLLAAHEFREPALQRALFRELHRGLAHHGRLLIVEHARDAANFLAFGPGFWHFLPASTWPDLAVRTRFHVVGQGRITPFVRWFLLEKPS